jgi:tetratricopeptide (TPR) repeat protein
MQQDSLPSRKADDDTDRLLDVLYGAEVLVRDLDQARSFLQTVAVRRQEQARSALQRLAATVRPTIQGLLGEPDREEMATTLLHRATALEAIATRLSANYEGLMQEMAGQGRAALRNAVRSHGRERLDELQDALKMVRGVLDHPIGGRNYAAWFDAGWIQWQLGGSLAEAEEGFYQASRLSGGERDRYHLHALRHLAHLQAAQGKVEDAYQTGQRALALATEDSDVVLEAARYAARTDRAPEAARLLEQVIFADVAQVRTVLAEPDLAALQDAVVTAVERRVGRVREAAILALDRWKRLVAAIEPVSEKLGQSVALPESLRNLPSPQADGISGWQTLMETAQKQGDAVYAQLSASIDTERQRVAEVALRSTRQIERMESDRGYWEGSMRNLEAEAQSAGISLHPYQFENPFMRRKNERAKEMRNFYAHLQQNLTNVEAQLDEQRSGLEADRESAEERLIELTALKESLDG